MKTNKIEAYFLHISTVNGTIRLSQCAFYHIKMSLVNGVMEGSKDCCISVRYQSLP